MDEKRKGIYNLPEMVHLQSEQTPDAVAVIFDEGSRDSNCITYSEMWERALKICDALIKNEAQNETIGVCLCASINLPSVLLGIMHSGSSFFPFGIDGHGFLQHSLQHLHVQHMIIDALNMNVLQPLLFQMNARVISCPALLTMGLHLVCINVEFTQIKCLTHFPGLAYCITTSGTTGTAKIVRVPYTCIGPNINDFRKYFRPTIGDIVFLASPLTFDPSIIDIFITLTSGAALLVVPSEVKMSPDRLLMMLYFKHKVTILQITPTVLGRFDSRILKKTLLGPESFLRVLAIGGESFPSMKDFKQWLDPANKTTIYNVYGITEVSCWASLNCVRLPLGCIKDPVHIGQPLTGTEIRMRNEEGQEIETGTGQIWIGGSERMCLLNDEDEKILSSGPLWRLTGDQGSMDSQGHIFCLGRTDRQIKRNGKRLDLTTLEKITKDVDCVIDCRAVYSDTRLYLFVVFNGDKSGYSGNMYQIVQQHLMKTLPSHYQPDIVTSVHSFPVNAHGKIDVTALLKLNAVESKISYLESSVVEHWGHDLWQKSLGYHITTVTPCDTFLSSGGDSLKAVQLMENIETQLHCSIPNLFDIILTGTYSDFLALLRKYSSFHHDNHLNIKQGKRRQITQDEDKEILPFPTLSAHMKTIQRSKSNDEERNIDAEFRASRVLKWRYSSGDKITKTNVAQANIRTLKRGISVDEKINIDSKLKDDKISIWKRHSSGVQITKTNELFQPQVANRRTSKKSKSDNEQININSESTTDIMSQWKRHSSDFQLTKTNPSFLTHTYTDLCMGNGEPCKCAVAVSTESNQLLSSNAHAATAVLPGDHCCYNHNFISGTDQRLSVAQMNNTPHFTCVCHKEIKQPKELHESMDEVCIRFSEHKEFVTSISRASKIHHHVVCGWMSASSHQDSPHDTPLTIVANGHNHSVLQMDIEALPGTCDTTDSFCVRQSVELQLQWNLDTGKCVDASPLIGLTRFTHKVVFIGSHSHKFYSINMANGEILWCTTVGGRVEGAACLSACGQWVVVGSYDHHIYVLDVQTGEIKWKVKTGNVVKCTPVADPKSGLILCGAHDTYIYALNLEELKLAWKWRARVGSVFSSPAIDSNSDVFFVATLAGHISAVTLCAGETVWTVNLKKPVFSSLALHDGHLYVGCVDGYLYCLNVQAGQQIWMFKTEAPVFSTPLITNRPEQAGLQTRVLFGSHDKHLYCLSSDGKLIWQYSCLATIYASPFVFRYPHTDWRRLKKCTRDERKSTICLMENNCEYRETIGKDTGDQNKDFSNSITSQTFTVCETQMVTDIPGCKSLEVKQTNNELPTISRTRGEDICINKCIGDTQAIGDCFHNESNRAALGEKIPTVYTSNAPLNKHIDYCDKNSISFRSFKVLHQDRQILSMTDSKSTLNSNLSHTNDLEDISVKNKTRELTETIGTQYVADELVAFASTDGILFILDLETGAELCRVKLPGDIFSSPVVVEDQLVVGCRDNLVYCYKINIKSV